jgi:hypothetical protein
MATFPALNPSTRIFTPGDYPSSSFGSWSGSESRVRNSNIMQSSQLRLRFIGITEAQMLSIVTHYQGQDGSFEAFTLPSEIWSGTSNPADYGLTGYSWRYAEGSPPSVDDMPCGGHDVEVLLVSAQLAGATTLTVNLTVNIALAAGVATAPAPFNQTVSVSLSPGAASGS